jgi:hypothetical protein
MKMIVSLVILFTTVTANIFAQDIIADKKTGLIKVDGKDAFYLVPVNKTFLSKDLRLENINHKELAYIRTENYQANQGGQELTFTFSATGNYCDASDYVSFNTSKTLAKAIVAARLIVDNEISEEAERKFLIMNKGTFLKDRNAPKPAEVNVTVNNNTPPANSNTSPAPSQPADIQVKENRIYNNSELAGSFKKTVSGTLDVITVYSKDDTKVADAKHVTNDNNADWDIILADGKKVTVLYNAATPLEKLFKYLVEKGYLK